MSNSKPKFKRNVEEESNIIGGNNDNDTNLLQHDDKAIDSPLFHKPRGDDVDNELIFDAKPIGSDSEVGNSSQSNNRMNNESQDYITFLRSQYKKVPILRKESPIQKNLGSIAEIESIKSEGGNSSNDNTSSYRNSPNKSMKYPMNNNTDDSTHKQSPAGNDSYTDVASLRKKYKNTTLRKNLSARTSRNNSIGSGSGGSFTKGVIQNNSSDSSLYYPSAEESYGEDSGLGSNIIDLSNDSSNHSSARPSRKYVRSSQPIFRTNSSATSNKSRNESLSGASYDRDMMFSNLDSSSLGDAMAAAAAVVRTSMKVKKNYKKEEKVLIALPVLSEVTPGVDEVTMTPLRRPTVAPVNKHGYPEGEGKTDLHRQGPFIYVLATVKKIHFKEDARHYTVERADTGAHVRADAGWMEPIEAGSDAEKKALEAAQRKEYTLMGKYNTPVLSNRLKVLGSSSAKITRKVVDIFKSQASNIVSGSYEFQLNISSINFIVLCSLIVAFLDLITHAFLKRRDDYRMDIILFIAWVVLVIELVFSVIVRPRNYGYLIRSTAAYSPSTVRYINKFHLVSEGLALLCVVPEFLPIFGVYPYINTVKAAIYSTMGNSRSRYVLGHFYMFATRLRLICLVRHLRNHWINALCIESVSCDNTSSKSTKDRVKSTKEDESDDREEWSMALQRNYDNEEMLPTAAKISSALLLVNSQRIMIMVLSIMLIVPFFLIAAAGGPNRTVFDMADYLHQINRWTFTDTDDADNCQLFLSSVEGWQTTQQHSISSLDVSFEDDSNVLVWAQVEPARCGLTNGVITPKPPDCERSWDYYICSNWYNTTFNNSREYLLLRDNYYLVQVVNENGAIKTRVAYNVQHTVHLSVFNSFLLQLTMLLFICIGLRALRYDANQLVILPLRRLLRIVLRYATNPLAASAPTSLKKKKFSEKASVNSIDDFGLFENDLDFNGNDTLGNYETERLITAVTKITDLLRKCWGVAGAGIISSNLARNTNGEKVLFNPRVPGKLVYALFGFAGINDYLYLMRSLDKDVMELINDIAVVLHNEAYRWGLGDSGQCNKNLGSAFLMVYRIGDFEEVRKKNDEAKKVIFSNEDFSSSITSKIPGSSNLNDKLNNIHLASLPGINAFGDRALLGLLKTFAGLKREPKLNTWEKDYRVGGGVDAFTLEMSFGMDAGWAVEGAVGSNHKIDATYLSSHVNMASRMMSACKQYKLAILLSQAVEELLSKECRSKLRHIDTVYVKGSKAAQRIYTYDARHQGVDFFLNKRIDAIADKEAQQYTSQIWDRDQDLLDIRSHISESFLNTYKHGLSQYLLGNWKDAVVQLEMANEIMIKDILESGRIEVVTSMRKRIMDPSTEDEDAIHWRGNLGDGPAQTIISYIKNRNCQCPDTWNGVRELTSK